MSIFMSCFRGSLGLLAGLSMWLPLMVMAQEKPDLNGLWFPVPGSTQTPAETPFTDHARHLRDEYVKTFAVSDDPGGWCIKPGLPRSIWGAPFPVEIVQTEGFINMFWEGYFQYRKIYMQGHDRPEPILHTGMGYSVAHWEGEVLVVETSHLREYPYMRRLPNTGEASVTERYQVENRKDENGVSRRFLVNELTLTDPRLYKEPVTIKGTLAWSPETPIMEYSCSEEIYEQHLLQRGLQVPDLNQ
ncbi:MAG: hypothetical protein RQ899_05940 [Pseudomonadales bacterium]|nr:hypothetical protein [Pseudomonadales bacterium]